MATSSSGGIDPAVLSAIISGGMNLAGGAMAGVGQGKLTAAQMQQQAEQARIAAAQTAFQQQQGQAALGLSSTQMDPMVQAQARQKQAYLESMMGGMTRDANGTMTFGKGPQGSGFSADLMKNYSPQARLASEQNFYGNVANASPNSQTPDFSIYGQGMGDAATANVNQQQQAAQGRFGTEQDAVNQALNKMSGAADQQTQDEAGSGFWHKLAKIAAPIAAIGLAPFTGGGSLGLMALGAGTGALGAWGAGSNPLTGAAMGAAGGALGGKVAGMGGGVAKNLATAGVQAMGGVVPQQAQAQAPQQAQAPASSGNMFGSVAPNQLPQGALANAQNFQPQYPGVMPGMGSRNPWQMWQQQQQGGQ
jgi:hypothetical protein